MSKVFFSIITPIYNAADYLEDCINSILEQSEKNYEIILINDASSDNSLTICKKYNDAHENINLIDNTECNGVSYSRNIGISVAVGQYIIFVDSDDYILTNTLSCSLNLIIKCGKPDLVILGYNRDDGESDLCKLFNKCPKYTDEFIIKINKIKDYIGFCWRYIYKHEVIKKNSIRFRDITIHEDTLFTTEFFFKCLNVIGIKGKFYWKRVRRDGLSSATDLHAAISCIKIIHYLNILYSDKISYVKKTYLINRIKFMVTYFTLRIITKSQSDLIVLTKAVNFNFINDDLIKKIKLFNWINIYGMEGISLYKEHIIVEKLKLIEKYKSSNIFIFCGGLFGEITAELLCNMNFAVSGIIDNNKIYKDHVYREIKYYPPSILKHNNNCLILICNQRDEYYFDIKEQIMQINKNNIIERITY